MNCNETPLALESDALLATLEVSNAAQASLSVNNSERFANATPAPLALDNEVLQALLLKVNRVVQYLKGAENALRDLLNVNNAAPHVETPPEVSNVAQTPQQGLLEVNDSMSVATPPNSSSPKTPTAATPLQEINGPSAINGGSQLIMYRCPGSLHLVAMHTASLGNPKAVKMSFTDQNNQVTYGLQVPLVDNGEDWDVQARGFLQSLFQLTPFTQNNHLDLVNDYGAVVYTLQPDNLVQVEYEHSRYLQATHEVFTKPVHIAHKILEPDPEDNPKLLFTEPDLIQEKVAFTPHTMIELKCTVTLTFEKPRNAFISLSLVLPNVPDYLITRDAVKKVSTHGQTTISVEQKLWVNDAPPTASDLEVFYHVSKKLHVIEVEALIEQAVTFNL